MASTAFPEEEFACSFCLEVLRDPATLPCGHTYCLLCIQRHWDQGEVKQMYSCPQCRKTFTPRPMLARSILLVEAMEKLKVRGRAEGGPLSISSAPPSLPPLPSDGPHGGEVYLQLPVSQRLCPEHRRPLELFCRDSLEFVCIACGDHAHRGHRVVAAEAERMERQRELVQMQVDTHRRIQMRERDLQLLPQSARTHKGSVQALQRQAREVFAELVRSAELTGSQVQELLCAHEAAAGSRAEGQIHRLEQDLAQLRRRDEELRRLAHMQDQWELVQMQVDTHRRIQMRERDLQLLPQSARTHKGSVQALQRQAGEVFAELVRSAELTGSQVQELLCAHEAAAGSRAEGQIHRLEQDLAQLRRRDEELRRLAHMQDHFCFLKNFLTLDTTLLNDEGGEVGASSEAALLGVQAALEDLRDRHQELCKASLAQIFRTVNDASVEVAEVSMATAPPPPVPSERRASANEVAASSTANHNPASGTANQNRAIQNPVPKTRDELLKFRFEPTLDPNTAFCHLRLSGEDRKATLRAETQPYPEHAERFLYWRQVLCREPLAGSPYYWEVEWTGQKVTIGVAYASMGRKGSDNACRLGHNDRSWGLYWSGTGYSLWHCGRETVVLGPKARRVGVYLDQQEGVLAFYKVSHDQAQLLHRVQADFSVPLHPGFRFWTGVGASVALCQLE